MSTSKSFIQKVVDFLKLGEEGKITRFQKYVSKDVNNQIKARNEQIEDLREKINDANDRKQEYLVNVDMERLNSTDNTKAYSSQYIRGYMAIQEEINNLNEQITTKETEIKGFTELLAELS